MRRIAKFGGILQVFVEAKEICVGKVRYNEFVNLMTIHSGEEGSEL
jgi:hypothetical protein